MTPLLEEFDTREEWLQARRTCIGSSDTPNVLGCGYAESSILGVYESKVLKKLNREASDTLRIGLLMEPALRSIFTLKTGLPCKPWSEKLSIVRHGEYRWLGASLDSAVMDPTYGKVPGELKNVGHHAGREWRDGIVPTMYQVQAQHQMLCGDFPACWLFGLVGGSEPYPILVERNDEFLTAVLPALREFWDCVEARRLPEVDDSEATAKALSRIFPQDAGHSVTLPDESLAWRAEIEAAKVRIKEYDATKTEYENRIKACLGDATFGILPDGSLYSWKTQSRKEYTVPAGTMRVLRWAKKKGRYSDGE